MFGKQHAPEFAQTVLSVAPLQPTAAAPPAPTPATFAAKPAAAAAVADSNRASSLGSPTRKTLLGQ